MIRFNNDYNHGAHNAIIQAIGEINTESYAGYGEDEWCQKGADEIRKYLGGADVDIHFMVGGTPANITVITAALRPYESVICAENGHINHHEAGSIEHTGHKILSVPAKEGKINGRSSQRDSRTLLRSRTGGISDCSEDCISIFAFRIWNYLQ